MAKSNSISATIKTVLLLIVGCLSACSPQQRLSCLLRHHPELTLRDTIHQFDVTLPIPAATDTLYLPIDYSDTPCDHYCDSLLHAALSTPAQAQAEHAQATLQYANQTLALSATQQPDTVVVQQQVRVPVVEYIAQPAQESTARAFFRISGIIAWILLATAIIIRIVKIFT